VKHPGVAIVVLVAFLMQGTVAISHAAENISIPVSENNVAAEETADALPASDESAESEEATTRMSAIPLTPEEQAVLTAKEAAETPEVMNQIGGGCKEYWSNENQRYETKCGSPWGAALGGAFFGGLLGSFGGAAGAAGGAVLGGGIGYLIGYGAYGN